MPDMGGFAYMKGLASSSDKSIFDGSNMIAVEF
jgi:hypothetical protein